MSFAAPVAARAAAGSASGAAGGAAARSGATKAAGKVPAKAPAKAAAAPDRARQLLEGGTSRKDAARVLRDEYGSTLAEAEGLLPVDQPDPPAAPASPAGGSGSTGGPSLPRLPRSATSAVNAGGGALLGALTYVLALTYLRDGLPGVKRWMAAKFLNRVDGAA